MDVKSKGTRTPGPDYYDVGTGDCMLSQSKSAPALSIGRKLKTWKEIEVACGYPVAPAPGGDLPVPSFVEEGRRRNKGVVFGHKTKTDDDIAKALGRYPRLAPGGSVRVESFAHDNKVQRRGVPFGHRLKSEMEMAQSLGRWSRLGPGGTYRCVKQMDERRDGLPSWACCGQHLWICVVFDVHMRSVVSCNSCRPHQGAFLCPRQCGGEQGRCVWEQAQDT